jgi:hypothetical protein
MAGKTQIQGGAFQDFEGNPLANGFLTMQLSHDSQETVDPGEVVAGYPLRIPLDANGNIAGAVFVWPNDQLTPAGSSYLVNTYRANGTQAGLNQQNYLIPSSPSPFNVGTWIPVSGTGPSLLGTAVLLTPSGDQTITADNLLPAIGNTSQSLGTAASRWNASLLDLVIAATLTDSVGSTGTAGQILSSTGIATKWIAASSAVGSFAALSSGTNTTAVMTVGSGAAIEPTGSGIVNANQVGGIAVSGTPTAGEVLTATSGSAADWGTPSSIGGVTISGTPSIGQCLVATSTTTADWQTAATLVPATGLRLQYGGGTGSTTITFSVAFSGTPTVLTTTGPGTGTTQLATVGTTNFTTVSSDGSPFTWLAIGPA